GLAVGPDDTLYVADSGNRKVRRIAPDGTVSTYAGRGPSGTADGAASSATFVMPAGLALDATGALYVSDAGAHTLRRVTPDMKVQTVAGRANTAGVADGTGTAARFDTPLGLAVTAAGDVLLADSANHSLRHVSPAGVVTTLAGSANLDAVGLDGPARETCLVGLTAIAIGPSGTPYLGTDNVRMLRSDGHVGSYAGTHGSLHVDGPHPYAAFTAISGLAFGPKNVLYVADGTRLRAIVPQHAPTP
ncbi:MAG: hypothetical protein ACK46X_17465, partial [Candidatus Sericytochromatia bacterium]